LANFFKDNPDLRRRIATAPWAAIVPALERDFTDPDELAPTSVEEAVEQIEMVLDLVGEMAAKEIHPHAAEVDRVGARLVDGKVIYPEPMQRGLELLSEAGLLGFSLPRVHGGMNLPITAYTAAVEIPR
jgi:alkylation response protein AidB-like acyl-CoA dehydrogenase